jgi:histone deacetylase 8
MDILNVIPSTYEDLIAFHSSAYIDFLQKLDDNNSSILEDEEEYGLGKHI